MKFEKTTARLLNHRATDSKWAYTLDKYQIEQCFGWWKVIDPHMISQYNPDGIDCQFHTLGEAQEYIRGKIPA